MQMRDDLGITTKLENGKAYLEFALPEKIGRLLSALQIEIWEGAEGERLVFHGEYSLEEADSMTALLLRPHLWDGMRDPYVYLVKAQGRFGTVEYGENMGGTKNEEESDHAEDITEAVEVYWQQELAIYDVHVIDKKGIFLNEKEYRDEGGAGTKRSGTAGPDGGKCDPAGRNRDRGRGGELLRSENVLQPVQKAWIPHWGPVDKTGKSSGISWIIRRNGRRCTSFGEWQNADGAVLLLSGEVEQRTGALSGTFHPASSEERAGLPDNLQQSEKSGALCGGGTFLIPVGRIR